MVERVWRDAVRLYSNARGMRPQATWFSGVASRTSPRRVEALRRSSAARRLEALIVPLNSAAPRRLEALAAVNVEQASAALRLTLIANISLPVGSVLLFNQLFPGTVTTLIESSSPSSVILALSMMAALMLAALWYSYSGVRQARDLLHLILIARSGATLDHAGAVGGEDAPAPSDLEFLS